MTEQHKPSGGVDLTKAYRQASAELIGRIGKAKAGSVRGLELQIKKLLNTVTLQLDEVNASALQQAAAEGKSKSTGLKALEEIWNGSAFTEKDLPRGDPLTAEKIAAAKAKMLKDNTVYRAAFLELRKELISARSGAYARVNEVLHSLSGTAENTVTAAKKAITQTFQSEGVLNVTFRNGAKVDVGAYAAMVARSARTESANVANERIARELGTNLVKCIGNDITCKVCAMYRDRVFCTDGKDKRFPSLTEGANAPLRHGYKLIHPNCYSADTEVYTDCGWKQFSELRGYEKIYTLNPNSRITEWQKPSKYIAYPYTGEMVHIYNARTELLITPDHNLAYYTKKDNNIKLKPAKEFSSSVRLYGGQNWHGNCPNTVFLGGKEVDTKLYCKLMAYYLADGSIRSRRTVKIAQCNNNWMYEELKGLPFRVDRHNDHIVIWGEELVKHLAGYGKANEKYVPDQVKKLSPDLIWEFLLSYAKTDGNFHKNKAFDGYAAGVSISLFTSSPRMAGELGELIMKAGYRPSFALRKYKDKQITFRNGRYTINHDIWVININKNTTASVLKMEYLSYDDYVYCLEVPKYHIILVRRKGKVIWCGNCRCEFVPYFEVLQSPEELAKDIEKSNRPFKDDRTLAVKNAYQDWQAMNRQVREERVEFENMQAVLGDRMPYETIGGYRRAVRQETLPTEIKKFRYRNRDMTQYERWVKLLGKDKMPGSLDKFQEMKYNKPEEYERLKSQKENAYLDMTYDEVKEKVGLLPNDKARRWYNKNVHDIPNRIDTTKALKEQAQQACDLRNQYRTQTRELMSDEESKKGLYLKRPNKTLEELVERKMRKKKLTMEEAYWDIIETASKTNEKVNNLFIKKEEN